MVAHLYGCERTRRRNETYGPTCKQQTASAMPFRKSIKKLIGLLVVVFTLAYIVMATSLFVVNPLAVTESLLQSSTTLFGSKQNIINTTCPTVRRPRPDDIRYRHEHWQVGSDDNDDNYEVVVYSAFYDDRPIVGDPPWIRILGVIAVFYVDGQPAADRSLYCHVWNDQGDTPYVVVVDSTVTGRDHFIAGNRVYGQRQFSCPLPPLDGAQWTPTHVSISISERCANSSILLPLSTHRRPPNFTLLSPSSSVRWQHEFVVCVESSFGSLPAEVVVEWIEAYRMFGVERFNIYNGNLTSLDTILVLEHYAKSGLVDLRHLPPSTDDYSEEGIRLGSPTSLNDCMMRNMYSARFIVVVDFDEIIVPRKHSNYSAMLDYIDLKLGLNISYHTYSFRNAYFFTFHPEDEAQPPYLRTLRLRRRSPPNDYLFGTKSFVDPRRCLSVFNHYCWILFGESEVGLTPLGTSVDVDVDVGLNHHYRYKCPADEQMCLLYNEQSDIDNTTLKFKDELDRRVRKALSSIDVVSGIVAESAASENVLASNTSLSA